MSQAYIGQIQPFGFNFAPRNWAMCNGQILSVSQNTALFSLLGTMYGGNGTSTFGLPNLQSRVPMHMGTLNGEQFVEGEVGGVETVTLHISNLPSHNHAFLGAGSDGNSANVADGQTLANIGTKNPPPDNYYAPDTTPQPLNAGSITQTGNNQAHDNRQPYLTLNWCICMFGVYPSRN